MVCVFLSFCFCVCVEIIQYLAEWGKPTEERGTRDVRMSKGSVCGQFVFGKSSSQLPPVPVSDAWGRAGGSQTMGQRIKADNHVPPLELLWCGLFFCCGTLCLDASPAAAVQRASSLNSMGKTDTVVKDTHTHLNGTELEWMYRLACIQKMNKCLTPDSFFPNHFPENFKWILI